MKIDFENAKIFVRPGSTDLRKGVTGLAEIIENDWQNLLPWNIKITP